MPKWGSVRQWITRESVPGETGEGAWEDEQGKGERCFRSGSLHRQLQSGLVGELRREVAFQPPHHVMGVGLSCSRNSGDGFPVRESTNSRALCLSVPLAKTTERTGCPRSAAETVHRKSPRGRGGGGWDGGLVQRNGKKDLKVWSIGWGWGRAFTLSTNLKTSGSAPARRSYDPDFQHDALVFACFWTIHSGIYIKWNIMDSTALWLPFLAFLKVYDMWPSSCA